MAGRFRGSRLFHRHGRWALFASAIALLAVAACQPLPRPFQPDDKRLNAADFARLGTRGGIIVAVPALEYQANAERLAGLVAAALRDRDIPAIAGPQDHSNRYVLSGNARTETRVGETVAISGIWRLIDPRGQDVMQFAVAQPVDQESWRNGEVATLALLADRVAAEMATQFARPSPAPQTAIATPTARVTIWSIGGLTDERSGALNTITQTALRARGITVVGADDPDALVLSGWVDRDTNGADTERIVIEWTVLRPNGEEVGIMSQSNVVAVGDFERYWTDVAPIIASAAADGLIEMLSAR